MSRYFQIYVEIIHDILGSTASFYNILWKPECFWVSVCGEYIIGRVTSQLQLKERFMVDSSDVNVSFFYDRKQFVFCFRSRKNECYVLFFLSNTVLLNVAVLFFFSAQQSLNKTQRFVSISKRNIKWWLVFVSISNLNEILSSRSKSCIRSDIKCTKKTHL
jgi:hypothetical protein